MKQSPKFNEYRISYSTDLSFSCFGSHAGEAIEQLQEFEGDSFDARSITSIMESVQTTNGWQPWKPVDLRKSSIHIGEAAF